MLPQDYDTLTLINKLLDLKEAEKVKRYLKELIDGKKKSIWFFGTGSNGKTTLVNSMRRLSNYCWVRETNTKPPRRIKADRIVVFNKVFTWDKPCPHSLRNNPRS